MTEPFVSSPENGKMIYYKYIENGTKLKDPKECRYHMTAMNIDEKGKGIPAKNNPLVFGRHCCFCGIETFDYDEDDEDGEGYYEDDEDGEGYYEDDEYDYDYYTEDEKDNYE